MVKSIYNEEGLLYLLILGEDVEFRLVYKGPLKAVSQSNPRRKEKHQLRKSFHRQLGQLWMKQSALTDFNQPFVVSREDDSATYGVPLGLLAERFTRGKFRFAPLVRRELNLVCDLDVLFLRREDPGNLLNPQGGDIDNRMLTLFDALQVPQHDQDLDGFEPGDGEYPIFYCLAESDGLITGFKIASDRLLDPPARKMEENDVELIVKVTVMATKLTKENMAYFSRF